ncbi:MAG: hypothetical protein FRX49_04785 [Trebouxia sp. A1-2]|nr:MAG: hypothetical protein FRX49_04785 [Trebouxia sp. A1-2]
MLKLPLKELKSFRDSISLGPCFGSQGLPVIPAAASVSPWLVSGGDTKMLRPKTCLKAKPTDANTAAFSMSRVFLTSAALQETFLGTAKMSMHWACQLLSVRQPALAAYCQPATQHGLCRCCQTAIGIEGRRPDGVLVSGAKQDQPGCYCWHQRRFSLDPSPGCRRLGKGPVSGRKPALRDSRNENAGSLHAGVTKEAAWRRCFSAQCARNLGSHGASLLPLSETVDRRREGEAGRLPVLPLVPADLDPADSLELDHRFKYVLFAYRSILFQAEAVIQHSSEASLRHASLRSRDSRNEDCDGHNGNLQAYRAFHPGGYITRP